MPPAQTAASAAAPATAPTISPDIARAAVHWLLELSPGDAQTREQWQAWLDADPRHWQAWQRIAQVDGQLRGVSTPLALQTLAAPGLARRHALRLALLLTAGAGGLLAARHSGLGAQAWNQVSADLSTITGERRETRLADGTRLWLDTGSAVDLHFSASERLIVLRAGEVLVHSAADPQPDPATRAPRPLRVRTSEGLAHAIGTRFTVRQRDGITSVGVLEGQVELQPRHGTRPAVRLSAGALAHFSDVAVLRQEPLPDGAGAWAQGMLIVDDMPLAEFIAELSRYRPGLLRCAPDAAQLRVSGSYPLADTDRVLQALTRSLPVRTHSRTRWWVMVERRG